MPKINIYNMKLLSYPIIKYRTKTRLRISKEPGLIVWISFLSIILIGLLTDFYLIPDYFILHAAFLSMCLIFCLRFMKTWDLIMDREEDLGIVISRSWYQILSIKIPDKNILRFSLSEISSVVVTSENTIDIKRANGLTVQILSEDKNYKLLKKLRKAISVFLCLERMEKITSECNVFYDWDIDPWSSSSSELSENQESDLEILDNNAIQNDISEESQFFYGSNIKIITGVL